VLFGSSTQRTTHISADVLLNALYMTISGRRTEQLIGFASDFRPPKTFADICVMHDDLRWKNRTTRYNRFWRAGCSRL